MKIRSFLLGLVVVLFAASILVSCGGKTASQEDAQNKIQTTNPSTEVQPVATNPTTNPATDTPNVPAGPTTTMAFAETEFDYGVVDQGEKVNHIYKFTNTGNEPLIISNAKGSCGCTVPSWPKEPIPVGGTGEIQVQFDSKGKKGKQSKRVTITANTEPAQSFLTIKGEVKAPEGDAAAAPAKQ